MKRTDFAEILASSIVAGLMFLVFAVFLGFPVKWAMNYLLTPSLLTAVFGVPQMDFWRAFIFALLCSILFKGSSSSSKKD